MHRIIGNWSNTEIQVSNLVAPFDQLVHMFILEIVLSYKSHFQDGRCQVSCGSQNEHVKHLAGIKHRDKANIEKVKENELPKDATMILLSDEQFMEGFKDDEVMLKTKDNGIRILEGEKETIMVHTVGVLKTNTNKKRGLETAFDQSDFIELAEKKFKKNA